MSPSTRRAWIEILSAATICAPPYVALHPEGVDRNTKDAPHFYVDTSSPSTRRAWIEIFAAHCFFTSAIVALHPEGVDRNNFA